VERLPCWQPTPLPSPGSSDCRANCARWLRLGGRGFWLGGRIVGRLNLAGIDFAFIDTPGIDSPGTALAIRLSDLCLIPCRPSPADLRGMAPTLAAIHRLERDFAFVLNQTPPKSYRVRDTAEGLKVLGMLAEVNVVMRNDHQDAIGAGQGVTEVNPEGAAADEMRRLWVWIDQRTKGGLQHVAAA
jgi:chromosome partitioning protein